jgi:hypothetical protein
MAETPLTPGTPDSQDPAATPQPSPPVDTGEAATADPALAEATQDDTVLEEPAVEGWSGTPVAGITEQAIARPESTPSAPGLEAGAAGDPIEINLSAAAAPIEPISPAEASVAAEPEQPAEPEAAVGPVEVAATETETFAVAATAAAATEPSIATTLEIPPIPGSIPADGGEFDLLIEKLRNWYNEADLAGQWQKLRGPIKGVALLLVAVLALRLYARLVGTLDAIPVVSGLLELTGLIYLLWFSATRLVRTSEREQVLADWKRRWQAFSGRV